VLLLALLRLLLLRWLLLWLLLLLLLPWLPRPAVVQALASAPGHACAQAPARARWRTCESQCRKGEEKAALVPLR
jgi:hypothetical protein